MTATPQQWRFKWLNSDEWSGWVDYDEKNKRHREYIGWNVTGDYQFRDKPTDLPIRPDRGAGVYYVRRPGTIPMFYSDDPGVGYEKIAGTA